MTKFDTSLNFKESKLFLALLSENQQFHEKKRACNIGNSTKNAYFTNNFKKKQNNGKSTQDTKVFKFKKRVSS